MDEEGKTRVPHRRVPSTLKGTSEQRGNGPVPRYVLLPAYLSHPKGHMTDGWSSMVSLPFPGMEENWWTCAEARADTVSSYMEKSSSLIFSVPALSPAESAFSVSSPCFWDEAEVECYASRRQWMTHRKCNWQRIGTCFAIFLFSASTEWD